MKTIIKILTDNGISASLLLNGMECNGITGVLSDPLENDMHQKLLFLKPGEQTKWNLKLTRHIVTSVSMLTYIPGADYNVIIVSDSDLPKAEEVMRNHFK